jgi:hypothetical protein
MGEQILDHVLGNISTTESVQVEALSSHEEASAAKPESFLHTLLDSTPEPSPEPRTPEEEEIQPPEFPFELEEELFKNLGHTLDYLFQKKPPGPEPPLILSKNAS